MTPARCSTALARSSTWRSASCVSSPVVSIRPCSRTAASNAAARALADRAPLPVEVRDVPAERLPEHIELTAYFVVSEALTNITKYAAATQAWVSVTHRNGRLLLEVGDDGVGGADVAAGAGCAASQTAWTRSRAGCTSSRSPAGARPCAPRCPLPERHEHSSRDGSRSSCIRRSSYTPSRPRRSLALVLDQRKRRCYAPCLPSVRSVQLTRDRAPHRRHRRTRTGHRSGARRRWGPRAPDRRRAELLEEVRERLGATAECLPADLAEPRRRGGADPAGGGR